VSNQFWSKVRIGAADECWEWQRYLMPNGYGHFRYKYKTWLTHRLSWTLENGDIPKELCVLHKCDNRKCVNPSHLFLGTYKDNAIDRENKGRGNYPSGQKTHCKRGHEFTFENTSRSKKTNQRICKKCNVIRSTNFQRKKAGKLFPII